MFPLNISIAIFVVKNGLYFLFDDQTKGPSLTWSYLVLWGCTSRQVTWNYEKKTTSWGHQNLLVILEIFRSSWKRFFDVILHNSRGHGNTANEVIAAWAGWLVRGKRWHSCMPQSIAAQANVGITIVCTLAYWLSSGASCFCPMCLLSSQPGGDLHFTLGSLCTACVTYGRWVKNMTCFQRRIFSSLTHV